MSKSSTSNELPNLLADDSGNSSETMTEDNLHLKQHQQQQEDFIERSLIDPSLLYLDQISHDSQIFYTQQFENQLLKQHPQETGSLENNTQLSETLNGNTDSFEHNPTPAGEGPPSIWSGLNNFIANVTPNSLFPTFPNIARSFTEYLSNHPVPFLSSLNNGQEGIPSSHFNSLPQTNLSNKRLHIRVLGVPQTGAKSRVETQIKLCIQLVTKGGEKAQWWSQMKLPQHMATKEKPKKAASSRDQSPLSIEPEKTLFLQAKVICASDPSKDVTICAGCIQREKKRLQRRKVNKSQFESEMEEDDASEDKILLFNCSDTVDFSAGDVILPTRITCYCRHHNEKIGFCIFFQLIDHMGDNIAEGISPPIMITDDHKAKAGMKRRRVDNEATPEPKSLPPQNWTKFLPFTNEHTNTSVSSAYPSFPLSLATVFSSASTPQIKNEETFVNNALNSLQPHQHQLSSATPLMKRLIPNEAPTSGNIEVTILGTDFRPGMTVMFGTLPATNVQYWSPNTIICTLPPSKQAGAVIVTFKDSPTTTKNDVLIFTYLAESDRALMELALQVIGMKMTGVVEDARKIAMRIVQGNNSGNSNTAEHSQASGQDDNHTQCNS
ncbi:hypothetical protein BY458DRAFT_501335 [Sporodiniella umbellata]|nr:hypothetical protein BY458DRAFT_501335 [Sporodiniella umbellata]